MPYAPRNLPPLYCDDTTHDKDDVVDETTDTESMSAYTDDIPPIPANPEAGFVGTLRWPSKQNSNNQMKLCVDGLRNAKRFRTCLQRQ